MKFTKRSVAGAIAGAVLAGGAAYAAMTLTGTGTAKADAYQGANLTISNEKFAKEIWPGVTTDFSFTVANSNPFPVTITQIAYDAAAANKLLISCATGEAQYLSGPVAAVGNALDLTSLKAVIPAKTAAGPGVGTVTIHDALHLDAAATAGCSVQVPFKVTGAGAGKLTSQFRPGLSRTGEPVTGWAVLGLGLVILGMIARLRARER